MNTILRPFTLAVLIAALLSLAGCASSGTSDGPGGSRSIEIGTRQIPINLDILNGSAEQLQFLQPIYDTLVAKAPDGGLEPSLATEWVWESPTELALTLRTDVEFDDGTPFDAEAVKANLLRYRDGTGLATALLAELVDVRVVDASHAVVVLEQPNRSLPEVLWQGPGMMVNPTALDDPEKLQVTPDGTGPYVLDTENTAVGTRWVYKARTDHWGGRPKFDSIAISAYTSETAMVNGLKTGEIDAAVLTERSSIETVKGDDSLTKTPYPFSILTMGFLDLNGEIDKPLADARVRRAISMALDRDALVEHLLGGDGEPWYQPAGKGTQAYDPELEGVNGYDPAKARRLLAEAGYPNGFSITMPRFTTLVDDAMGTALAGYLEDVGIKVKWEPLDEAGLYTAIVQEKKYSSLILPWATPDDGWQIIHGQLHPAIEIQPYDDPVGLEIVAKIRKARSVDEAIPLYRAFNRQLVESARVIPIMRPMRLLVTSTDVTAVPQNGLIVPSIDNYGPAE